MAVFCSVQGAYPAEVSCDFSVTALSCAPGRVRYAPLGCPTYPSLPAAALLVVAFAAPATRIGPDVGKALQGRRIRRLCIAVTPLSRCVGHRNARRSNSQNQGKKAGKIPLDRVGGAPSKTLRASAAPLHSRECRFCRYSDRARLRVIRNLVVRHVAVPVLRYGSQLPVECQPVVTDR